MYTKSVILNFPPSKVDKPVISSMIRQHDVEVNILQANVTQDEEGRMFTIFQGTRQSVLDALAFLRENQVRTILPVQNLVWDEERCVGCGACVGQCPARAFRVEAASGRVVFDDEKCVACELCVPACSYGAVQPVSENLASQGEA